MFRIEVNKKGGLEKALKEYKSKIIKSGMLKELRERLEYEKKTTKRRKKMANARWVQKKKDNL